MGIFDFLFSSRSAGRDYIHKVNKTHIEYGTRRVAEQTSGFRLFDVHAEGAGTSSTGSGMTGIGLVGEFFIILLIIYGLVRAFRKCAEKKVRSEGYKAYYRHHAGPNRPTDKYGPMITTRPVRQIGHTRTQQEEEIVTLVCAYDSDALAATKACPSSTQNSPNKKFVVEV